MHLFHLVPGSEGSLALVEEAGGVDHSNSNGHKGMSGTADLTALTIEASCSLDESGHMVQSSRAGIDLNTKGGHSKGMQHICGGNQETNGNIGGKNQLVVHLQQTETTKGKIVVLQHIRVEAQL